MTAVRPVRLNRRASLTAGASLIGLNAPGTANAVGESASMNRQDHAPETSLRDLAERVGRAPRR